MSIARALLGRQGRNDLPGEKRHRGLLGLRNRIGWDQIYLGTSVLLLVALCYKLAVLWTLAFLILAAGCWTGRRYLTKVNFALIIALLYVADATTTAFLVSTQAGVYRTAQFVLISASLVGIFAHSCKMQPADCLRVLKIFAVVSCLIFSHLIIYHVLSGRYITWKYLADTKIIISLTVFLCFSLKDQLTKRVPFLAILAILTLLIIMSAERKALLLLAVLLLFSNLPVYYRIAIFLVAPLILIIVAVLGIDGGYLYSKFQASSENYAELSDRYFMTVHNIGDLSNIIREFTNRQAWQLFEDNPWFGIGATGYWEWANAMYGRGNGLAMNVHGEVHRIPAEGGIVGMIIAATYIAVIGWRTGHFAFLRASRSGSSLERTPLYMLLYVMCYAYAEAIDSAMLVLIGLAGVVSARLPPATIDTFVRRRPPSTRKVSIPMSARHQRHSLVRRLAGR